MAHHNAHLPRIRVLLVCCLLSILSAIGCLPRPKPGGSSFKDLPVNRLWMVIQIQGQDVRLPVDLGASRTFLLRSEARRLGLRIEEAAADVVAGPGEVVLATAKDVEISLDDQKATTDLAVVDDPPYSDVVGAVGWDWLSQVPFVIHWVAREISFAPGDYSQGLEGFRSYRLSKQVPIAAIALDAEDKELVYLDTGSFGGAALSGARWARFLQEHPRAVRTLHAQSGTDGLSVSQIAWAGTLLLGALELHDTLVESCSPGQAALPGFLALLGNAALNQFHLVVDGPGAQVLLRPNPDRPAPGDYNRAGVVFLPRGPADDSLVAHVVAGGPAQEAGLRDGDVLWPSANWT
jgi:hypothetical protein